MLTPAIINSSHADLLESLGYLASAVNVALLNRFGVSCVTNTVLPLPKSLYCSVG